MRFNAMAAITALCATGLQGCAVQSPPSPVVAAAVPVAECQSGFDPTVWDELAGRHRQLLRALNAGQLEEALSLYAPEAIVVGPRREEAHYGGRAWVRHYLQEQLLARGAHFEDKGMLMSHWSHCGVIVGGGQYRLALNGEMKLRPYLIAWRRINGELMVIAHQIDLTSNAAP